jgi:hypothetical protein
MQKMFQKLLQEHGSDLIYSHDGQEEAIRGFFRMVNSTSWQSIEKEATPLGEMSRGQYVYIGSPEHSIREGETLQRGAKSYLIRRAEPVWYKDALIYVWALCVEKGVNDTWGTQS